MDSIGKRWLFPDGSSEGYVMRVGPRTDGPHSGNRPAGADSMHDNAGRASRRAKGAIRRYCRMYDLRRMLTFTLGDKGDGWPDAKSALGDVMEWLVHGEGREIVGKRLIAVCEVGKHGRVHVHAAVGVNPYISYDRFRLSWSRFLNTKYGWRDGREHFVHVGGRPKASARKAGFYIAKYITKSDDNGVIRSHGEHRYRTIGMSAVQASEVVRGFLVTLHARFGCAHEPHGYQMENIDEETGEVYVYGYGWT